MMHHDHDVDLHMVLVANSELELNLGGPTVTQQSSWILNHEGLEKLAIDKSVIILSFFVS